MKNKQPTWTSLVLHLLEEYAERDGAEKVEFMTIQQIAVNLGATRNQISAALCEMRKYGAVDVVVQDSIGWWFATAKDDTRTKHVLHRALETKQRQPRKKKVGPARRE